MNILAMKIEMFEILSQTYDETLLLKLYKTMKEVFETTQTDWWDDLPIEQQARLQQSIDESYDEENLIDHADMQKKHAKWLKQ
jgi:TRAP-type C4-dicarboxylate transport system substrate-binding protein